MELMLAIAAVVVAATANTAATKAIQPNKHDRDDDKSPHAGVVTVTTKRASITRHLSYLHFAGV